MAPVRRLRGRRAFADLAQRGRTVRSGPLRVRYLAASDGLFVGYAIGKKVGPAVVRNRIRRRLRAAVDQLDRRGGVLLPSTAYLLSAGPEAATCSFAELLTWVEGALCNAATAAGHAP